MVRPSSRIFRFHVLSNSSKALCDVALFTSLASCCAVTLFQPHAFFSFLLLWGCLTLLFPCSEWFSYSRLNCIHPSYLTCSEMPPLTTQSKTLSEFPITVDKYPVFLHSIYHILKWWSGCCVCLLFTYAFFPQ